MSRDLRSADAGDEFSELVDSVRQLRALQEGRDVIVAFPGRPALLGSGGGS